jgi:D-alanine-D-alanine ligase
MKSKLRVGIIFGGKSVEHEVSIISAKSVIETMDKERFDVVPMGVTKEGRWLSVSDSIGLLHGDTVDYDDLNLLAVGSKEFMGLIRVPDPGQIKKIPDDQKSARYDKGRSSDISAVDVVFPLIHGAYGEDGKLQGLLEIANIPYVGAGPLSSAVGMDKDMMKRLFRFNGIPITDYKVIYWSQFEKEGESLVKALLKESGFPVFVKPACTGSSVGISKVKSIESLSHAIREAFRYDEKVLMEKAVLAREIECSVLGNDDPIASIPGEIVPCHEFYDYKAKYIDEGSELIIPAKLSEDLVKEVQQLSIKAFKVLECSGMARVDLFLDKESNKVFLNELNTIPGFTPISMYPKLLEHSGIPFKKLITRLIHLALERHERRKRLESSYEVGVE